MAYHLVQNPTWNSGTGTDPKYTFHLDVYVDVVSVVGTTATISVQGTYGVTNYSTNLANATQASDFALIAPGDADAWDYQFTPGVDYYEAALPVIPNAPSTVTDRVLLEFRGDTWRNDPTKPGNRSSLWAKGAGVVLDQLYTQAETKTFNISTTFTIDVSGGGNTPILAYVRSGWTPGPIYEWLDHEVLVSWIELNYIPGEVWDGTAWLSHNRATNGHAKIHTGSGWSNDMMTADGGVASGDPPEIRHASDWKNMRRLGVE